MIRVLIADDQALVRAGLAALLNGISDIEVVATAADGDQAVALARELQPDVACVDVRMPGRDGISVATELCDPAGLLLLPSSVLFAGSLLLAAFLMQKRGVPPFATVPIGIVALMIAMWMLSGSTGESGVSDMRTAILLRGLGLGFLFLSIILIAFNRLSKEHLATGIGLFNTGRQMGVLIGVALLQTIIDRSITSNNTVLAAGVSALDPATISRLTQTATQLSAKGMDMTTADSVAVSLLGRSLVHQSSIIAFDTAFNAVALMFLFAAPVLIAIKLGLARRADTARRVREAIGC